MVVDAFVQPEVRRQPVAGGEIDGAALRGGPGGVCSGGDPAAGCSEGQFITGAHEPVSTRKRHHWRAKMCRSGNREFERTLPTIDLVYFNAGGGHRSAATALETVIREQGRAWQVRRINLMEVLDPKDIFGKTMGMKPEDLVQHAPGAGLELRPRRRSSNSCRPSSGWPTRR